MNKADFEKMMLMCSQQGDLAKIYEAQKRAERLIINRKQKEKYKSKLNKIKLNAELND